MIYFTTVMLSLFITVVLIPILKGQAAKVNCVDLPCERKVHQYPTPKVGGIAMAAGMVLPIVLWAPLDGFTRSVLIGSGLLVFFGLLDDIKDLGYRLKFSGQLAAALVTVLYGGIQIRNLGGLMPDGMPLPLWLAIPLTVVVIVGVTNAVNLSDGLDGLAGGITAISFVCIALMAYRIGNTVTALFAVAVVGAIFGFLRFNTYPAIIFMGDAGSQLLGFLAIVLSLKLTQGDTPYSPLFPMLLLGFPVLDTLTVMSERIANGRSPFVADKNHFHHRLMRLGFFHSEAVLAIYVIQALLTVFAYIFRFYAEWFLLVVYVLFAGIVLAGFRLADRKNWRIPRYDLVDHVIKGKLRVLKDKQLLIKLPYRAARIGLPALLFITCLIPGEEPVYFAINAVIMAAALILLFLFKKAWISPTLRVALYLTIPFLIFLSEIHHAGWLTPEIRLIYNLSFGFLVFFLILTLKFTRRRTGFKATTMDFLVLLIALAVPNIPALQDSNFDMGLIAIKIIVMLFGFEVLIGESRGELNQLGAWTCVCLVVLGVKGVL